MTDSTVYLIGAGPGNEGLITVRGLELVRKADVLVYDQLGTSAFLNEVPENCQMFDVGKSSGNHKLTQDGINELLSQKAKEFKTIVRLKGGDPYIFGRGGEEDKYFTLWCAQYRNCTYVNRYTENMYIELIIMSHLDVMVSMDSANMHLASLTAIPVLSIWGATHPYAGFMGFGQPADNAIQLNLDCRPCSIYGNKPCKRGDYACLQNIPPERIVDKITSIINN